MPLLQKDAFKAQMWELANIYRRDNEWVGRFIKPDWRQDPHMEMYIDAAYKLYRSTTRNELKLTLLGGTEIRKAKHLVENFGVTATNGVQDPETIRIAMDEQAARNNGKGMTPPDARTKPDERHPNGKRVIPVHAVPVMGVGSILSESNWTPMLNDALIVGGATAEREFQVALEPSELGLFRECVNKLTFPLPDPGALTPPQRTRHFKMDLYLNQDYGISEEIWKEFMARNMGMLWDPVKRNPRVLARELLGLSFLGYYPVFYRQQLFFKRKPGAPAPTFQAYVDGLADIEFQDPQKRIDIIKRVSRFLFGDENAICTPQDRQAVQPNDPRWFKTAAQLRKEQRYAKVEF